MGDQAGAGKSTNWPGAKLKDFRNTLSVTFDSDVRIRMVLADFEFNTSLVAFNAPVSDIWFTALQELQRFGELDAFVRYLAKEFPKHPEFSRLATTPASEVRSGEPADGMETGLRVSDGQSYLNPSTWRHGLETMEGRTCFIRFDESNIGTGFLVGPRAVLTVFHNARGIIENPRRASDVAVRFDYKRFGEEVYFGTTYRLDAEWLIDHSPFADREVATDAMLPSPEPDHLNYAVLRLAGTPGKAPRIESPFAVRRGWVDLPDHAQQVRIGDGLAMLHHAQGLPMALSFNPKAVVAINDNRTRIRYDLATFAGSSGAPCFDMNWNLVALQHRRGGPVSLRMREGVPADAIRRLLSSRGKLALLEAEG